MVHIRKITSIMTKSLKSVFYIITTLGWHKSRLKFNYKENVGRTIQNQFQRKKKYCDWKFFHYII